ncbi:MAG: hypothetical protein ACK5O2_13650 [Microthrixaceae bacterium]
MSTEVIDVIAGQSLRATLDVLAADSSGVLMRSFGIALLIMAPVALWQGWRIRERRRSQQSSAFQEASDLATIPGPDEGQSLEAVVARINRLASTMAPGERTELDVPANLTVGGRPAETSLVEVVLRDAMDRSGMEMVATTSDGASVRLVCLRR